MNDQLPAILLAALISPGFLSHAVSAAPGHQANAFEEPPLPAPVVIERAGAALNWDLDAIRRKAEAESTAIDYPGCESGLVRGVPTKDELERMTTEQAIALCADWNPATRHAILAWVSSHRDAAYEHLSAHHRDDGILVRAGCVAAVGGLLESYRQKDREMAAWLSERFGTLMNVLRNAADDAALEVRSQVPGIIGRLYRNRANCHDIALAAPVVRVLVTKRAIAEDDIYLRQEIAVALENVPLREIFPDGIPTDAFATLLSRQHLPNGTGKLIRVMKNQFEAGEIDDCLPALLEVYRKPSMRDPMSFPGGRDEAFELIASRREKHPRIFRDALIATNDVCREWWALGTRFQSRARHIWKVLESAGPDAKEALPGLRFAVAHMEAEKHKNPDAVFPRESLDLLNQAITAITSGKE